MRNLILFFYLFLYARGSFHAAYVEQSQQLTCTAVTCPSNAACVLTGTLRACCPLPLTCRPPCVADTSPCPGLPELCCPIGFQCTSDQGMISCGPSSSPTSSPSNSSTRPNSSFSSASSSSTSVSSSSPSASSSVRSASSSFNPSSVSIILLPTPSASPGKQYNVSCDDPSITYNGPPDTWTPINVTQVTTDPSCSDVETVRSTKQINASVTFPFVGTGISVRCVVSPQGGSFAVTIGNQTQRFNASSRSGSTSCGIADRITHSAFKILAVHIGSVQTDIRNVTIANEGGVFSFIGATVLNEAPILSSAGCTTDNGGLMTFVLILMLYFVQNLM